MSSVCRLWRDLARACAVTTLVFPAAEGCDVRLGLLPRWLAMSPLSLRKLVPEDLDGGSIHRDISRIP